MSLLPRPQLGTYKLTVHQHIYHKKIYVYHNKCIYQIMYVQGQKLMVTFIKARLALTSYAQGLGCDLQQLRKKKGWESSLMKKKTELITNEAKLPIQTRQLAGHAITSRAGLHSDTS